MLFFVSFFCSKDLQIISLSSVGRILHKERIFNINVTNSYTYSTYSEKLMRGILQRKKRIQKEDL